MNRQKRWTCLKKILKELLNNIADNEEAKQVVVDVIFSLEDKKHLDGKVLKQYISENISCINENHSLKQQNQLKENYHSAKDDELSALQLQYQVRELIKSNQTRLETIND